MNSLVPIAMFGWIGVVLLLFWQLSPRRAIIVAFVGGWLFLPMAKYELPGPDWTKASATCGSVLLAAMIFDSRRMLSLSFFPALADIPMLIWCLCPLASALSNAPDLTLYDGLSAAFEQTVTWGLPYLIGRIYLGHLLGLKELSVAIFIGGLLYVPLCLIEMRFSPQLHLWVYGYHQHDFGQSIRESGYRPMVFMEHGLAVAMFMTTATIAGVWLWRTGAIKRIATVPIAYLVVPLLGVTVLLKSAAALMFLMAGLAALIAGQVLRTRLLITGMMLIPVIYVTARVVGEWDAPEVVEKVREHAGDARAQSFEYRLENERLIAARAERHPTFGWGLFGRAFVKDFRGNIVSTPDSLWIIALGQTGMVGLMALGALMIPVAVALWRLPMSGWTDRNYVGVVVAAVLLALYALDNLLNNMPNPIFLLALGGVSGLVAKPITVRKHDSIVMPFIPVTHYADEPELANGKQFGVNLN